MFDGNDSDRSRKNKSLSETPPLYGTGPHNGKPSESTIATRDYIAFLWDAFDQLHPRQVPPAFLAYHMLTMSFVYSTSGRFGRPAGGFEKGLIGFAKTSKNLLAQPPFVFSSVNERSILRLGRSSRRSTSIPESCSLIACDNGKIGTYAKLVDDRNETAHPNGNIFSTQATDTKITEMQRVADEIQTHPGPSSNTPTASSYSRTTTPRNANTPTPPTNREMLIHGNYLSRKTRHLPGFDVASPPIRPETRIRTRGTENSTDRRHTIW